MFAASHSRRGVDGNGEAGTTALAGRNSRDRDTSPDSVDTHTHVPQNPHCCRTPCIQPSDQ